MKIVVSLFYLGDFQDLTDCLQLAVQLFVPTSPEITIKGNMAA